MSFTRGPLSEKENLRFSRWSLFWEKGRERFVNFLSFCALDRCKLINLIIPVTYLFVYLVQGVREFLVKWSGWGSEFSSWEPEEHFLNPAIIT